MGRDGKAALAGNGRARAWRRLGVGTAHVLALLALLATWSGVVQSQELPPLLPKKQSTSAFEKPKGGPFGTPKRIDRSQPLLLNADELVYDTRGNRVIARGHVEAYYNEYILTADQVIYDQSTNTLTAEGNAFMKEPNGNVVRANRLVTAADFSEAFGEALSVVAKDESRIVAEQATRRNATTTEYQRARYSPCKNDDSQPPLWCLSAARIVHDQQAATISYEGAAFELFGVPVLYLPYFEHPDPSVKRRSGFLIPEFRSSTQLGYQIEVPYFFALAPNYDFLFHPLFTSKQGVLWQGDWRHRVSFGGITGLYSFKFAGVDQNDDNFTPTSHIGTGWRGSVETKGQFSLASWWTFGWDITLESDDSFRRFFKLDSVLQTDRVNTVYIEGISKRNYFSARLYHFGGLLLDDTPHAESMVHPVIDYNYIYDKQVLGGELSFSANALSLSRSDGTDMARINVEGRWRRQLIDPLGQVWTPFLSIRGDAYRYNNYVDPNTLLPVPEEVVTRGMATAALTYSYPFVLHNATGSHIVEPTVQIVARPARIEQRVMPDEDARSLVWDDTLLFDVDKFSGWDRIETGTRGNVGVQYTFQAKGGGYARIIAGQSFQLAGQNPYTDPGLIVINGQPVSVFSPKSGLETDTSDYVLGLYVAPVSVFQLVAQGRFDETDLTLRRANLYTQMKFGLLEGRLQYSFTHADPTLLIDTSQQELLGQLKLAITDRWSITGTMRYDLDARERLQDAIAVSYRDECFVLTAQYTETFIENPLLNLKQDRSIMVRFELKNIGQYHHNSDTLSHIFADNQPPKL